MTEQLSHHVPPQGNPPVYRRLARSYGPLAVAALLLVLMALLVPTQATEAPRDDADGSATENGFVVEVEPPVEPAHPEVHVR